VPDIPLEETPEVRKACEKYGLELVLLTTPTTPQVRPRTGVVPALLTTVLALAAAAHCLCQAATTQQGSVRATAIQMGFPWAAGWEGALGRPLWCMC
jgi:hypothetical protein